MFQSCDTVRNGTVKEEALLEIISHTFGACFVFVSQNNLESGLPLAATHRVSRVVFLSHVLLGFMSHTVAKDPKIAQDRVAAPRGGGCRCFSRALFHVLRF